MFGVDDLGGELGRPEVRNEERRAVAIGETWGDSEGMLVFIKGREVCEQWMSDLLEGNREKISCIVFETEFVNKYMYACQFRRSQACPEFRLSFNILHYILAALSFIE